MNFGMLNIFWQIEVRLTNSLFGCFGFFYNPVRLCLVILVSIQDWMFIFQSSSTGMLLILWYLTVSIQNIKVLSNDPPRFYQAKMPSEWPQVMDEKCLMSLEIFAVHGKIVKIIQIPDFSLKYQLCFCSRFLLLCYSRYSSIHRQQFGLCAGREPSALAQVSTSSDWDRRAERFSGVSASSYGPAGLHSSASSAQRRLGAVPPSSVARSQPLPLSSPRLPDTLQTSSADNNRPPTERRHGAPLGTDPHPFLHPC